MSRFAFPMLLHPPRVTFGSGSVRSLLEVPIDDRTVVFSTGQASVVARVVECLERKGGTLVPERVLRKPPGEPTRESVEAGATWLGSVGLDRIHRLVGIGGGSVLDWCRLSWAVAADALDLDGGRLRNAEHKRRPSFWLVPTTCATGAEASTVAVYSDAGRKVAVPGGVFLADRVILDSQFLQAQSPQQMANALGDVVAHAIEAFVSIVPNRLAKEAAVAALALILRHGRKRTDGRFDELMEAGFLGGLAASHCSVGVVHAFAHTVARLGVPHGFACGIAIEAGIRANADVPAMQELASRVGVTDVGDLIRAVAEVVAAADAGEGARRLSQALADPLECDRIAASMAADVCMRTNPRALDEQSIGRFLSDVRVRVGMQEGQ